MSREVLPFTDEASRNEARARDLTSTDVAALFGVSPYLTPFELWHRKRGALQVDDIENERTRWGNILQNAIAQGFANERGLLLRRMDQYVRMPPERIGSSFDFCSGNMPDEERGTFYIEPFLVECKNVDSLAFRRGWIETDFGLEAPAHIELQAQHQCLVADVKRIYIVALVGGNTLHVLERERDDVIAQRILDAAAELWARTEPPDPDFSRDAYIVSRLHGYSSEGSVIQADDETVSLMRDYKLACAAESAAKDQKDEAKARILMRIGEAERVESDIYTLSAKMLKPVEVKAHTREGRRDFRIHERSTW